MRPLEPLDLETISSYLSKRPLDAHKGMFGRILVIGGDYGMPGAVRLAAEGALRIGAGLVTVLTHPLHITAVMAGRPELLCYGLDPELKRLDELLDKATVILLGSGLGQSDWSYQLFERVIKVNKPLLLDADALNCLANKPEHKNSWVLTPHPGEAARLLGLRTADIQENRLQAIEALQARYGGVIVLKGAGTLISSEHRSPIMRSDAGNPAMASAGMGDLLSGMIAGLMGQGLSNVQASEAGVLLHALAADRVVNQRGARGLLASDLLDALAEF